MSDVTCDMPYHDRQADVWPLAVEDETRHETKDVVMDDDGPHRKSICLKTPPLLLTGRKARSDLKHTIL